MEARVIWYTSNRRSMSFLFFWYDIQAFKALASLMQCSLLDTIHGNLNSLKHQLTLLILSITYYCFTCCSSLWQFVRMWMTRTLKVAETETTTNQPINQSVSQPTNLIEWWMLLKATRNPNWLIFFCLIRSNCILLRPHIFWSHVHNLLHNLHLNAIVANANIL